MAYKLEKPFGIKKKEIVSKETFNVLGLKFPAWIDEYGFGSKWELYTASENREAINKRMDEMEKKGFPVRKVRKINKKGQEITALYFKKREITALYFKKRTDIIYFKKRTDIIDTKKR